jgi:hypothetical protein
MTHATPEIGTTNPRANSGCYPDCMVGADMLFGLVLAVIGNTVRWALGSISAPVLLRFAVGGVPGVVLQCLLALYSRGTVDRIGIVTGPDPSTPITTWQLPSTIAPGSTIRHGVWISALTIAFA